MQLGRKAGLAVSTHNSFMAFFQDNPDESVPKNDRTY